MRIEIPDNWLGKKLEGSLEKLLSKEQPKDKDIAPFEDLPEIIKSNPHDYIWVPEKNIAVAKRQAYDGFSLEQAIKSVNADNLRLLHIDEMMQHYLNARDAANGKRVLQDLGGNTLSRTEATELWNYLSSIDRKPFGNKPFWTWLDALFKETPQGMEMHTQYLMNGEIKSRLITKLDSYAGNNDWVELSSLNNQGLPINNSSTNSYVQGQNFYFWRPKNGKVAGFGASSGGAVLYCDWVPSVVDSRLGVLACVAGSREKNSGGSP